MPEALKDKQFVIGAKQVMKAIRTGSILKAYIASDCDPIISRPVIDLAQGSGVTVEYIPTRKQLGEMCGIKVKAACAAVVNN